jgi:ligand-binding sensor domain-containing protein
MGARAGFLACVMLAATTAARAERLPIRTYTNLDGLAHMRITCVFSDSRGFVWFCSPDGLSRFDGQRFITYDVRDGLGSARINDFIETAAGRYWVATNGAGVYRYQPLRQGKLIVDGRSSASESARFEHFGVGDSPRTDRVNVLYDDRAGTLWAGTDAGLFRLENTTFQPVDLFIPGQPARGLQVWALAEDRRGHLWIGTSWGLVERRADGRLVHSTLRPTQGSDHVFALLVDSHDRVWIGHATGIVLLQAGSELEPQVRTLSSDSSRPLHSKLKVQPGRTDPVWLTSADGLAPGMVHQIVQSRDGDIWVATREGLTHIKGGSLRTLSTANGVGKPTDLTEDDEGNLWIGTENGAQRFSRDGFRTYTESDGLVDSAIRTVFEDDVGVVYAVSLNQRLHRFDGTRFTSVRPNLVLDDTEISSGRALRDRAGEWWIAGAAGVYRFPPVTRLEQLARIAPLALYTARDGLAGDDVMEMFEDSRGDIWIARRYPTTQAVTRWDRSTNTFHIYGIADGLPGFNRIVTFAEDGAGNVWAGLQNGGVARYRQGRFTVFTQT